MIRPKKLLLTLPEERAEKLIKKYNLPEECGEAIKAALREAYQRGHDCDVVRFKTAEFKEAKLDEPPEGESY